MKRLLKAIERAHFKAVQGELGNECLLLDCDDDPEFEFPGDETKLREMPAENGWVN